MKHSQQESLRKRILIIGVIIVAVLIGVLVFSQLHKVQPNLYEKNQEVLKKMEKSDISETEKRWEKLEEQNQKTKIDPSKRNEYGIVELDNVALKKAFSNTVIVGDSFSEAIVEYEFLDSGSVIYKRGASIKSIDDLIEKVISMKPSAIVMEFGCNDLTIYGTDIDGFIEQYRTEIGKIKKELPDAAIYVNSILPMTEEKQNENEGRKKQPEYNKAIEKMCDEEGYMYIDSSFIIEKNPDLYEPDGIHVTKEYYEQWLSYLVEKAGL